VFFSNFADALSIDDTERRYLAYWTNAPAMTEAEANEIWEWYKQGGLQLCARYLTDRNVSGFNPRAAAMRTTFHATLAASGKTDVESGLQTLIDSRTGPFAKDLVSPDDAASELNDGIVNARAPGGLRKTVVPQQISTALTTRQWVRLNRIDTTRDGKRVTATLFAQPDVAAKYRTMKSAEVYKTYMHVGARK
jgi:hypothetical protein